MALATQVPGGRMPTKERSRDIVMTCNSSGAETFQIVVSVLGRLKGGTREARSSARFQKVRWYQGGTKFRRLARWMLTKKTDSPLSAT